MGEDLAHHRAGVGVVLDEEGMKPGKVRPWCPRGGLTFLGPNDLPAALFLLVHGAPGVEDRLLSIKFRAIQKLVDLRIWTGLSRC